MEAAAQQVWTAQDMTTLGLGFASFDPFKHLSLFYVDTEAAAQARNSSTKLICCSLSLAQAKDQAELNELVIWAAARGLLADVS